MAVGLKVVLTNGEVVKVESDDFEYEHGVFYVYMSNANTEDVLFSAPQSSLLYVQSFAYEDGDKPSETFTPDPVCKREAFSGGGSPSPRQCGVCSEGPCTKQPVEEWPKYYVGRLWSTEDAYVRIDSRDGDGVWVNWKGQESKRHAGYPTPEKLTCWSWDEVTKEQAMARVTHPQQVESPDDWVTQDRVPVRVGVDEFRYKSWTPDCWKPVTPEEYFGMEPHGHIHPWDGDVLELRCRRKNLPPLPANINIGDSVVITEDPKRDDSWNGCRRTVQAKVKNGYVVGKVGEPISRIYLERELRVVPKPDGE